MGCASSRMCPRAGKNPEMSLSTNRRLLLFWFLTQALFVPETEKDCGQKWALIALCVPQWWWVSVSPLVSLHLAEHTVLSTGHRWRRKWRVRGGELWAQTNRPRTLPAQGGWICLLVSTKCQVPEVPTSQPRTLPAQGDSWSLESARCSQWAEPSSRSGENKVISGHWYRPGGTGNRYCIPNEILRPKKKCSHCKMKYFCI